jgi:hypothetical protein
MMSRARAWIVLLLAISAVPAWAQQQDQDQTSDQTPAPTRAALLEAERARKATATVPPQRGTIERALFRYDHGTTAMPFVFAPWHGLHLGPANFPAGAGVKVGVAYTHDLGRVRPTADPDRPNRFEIDTLGAYSTRGYSRVAASLNVYHVGGTPIGLTVRGQHYEYPEEDFFGLGQDSHKRNRTDYLLRSTEGGAGLRWQATRHLDVTGAASYLTPTIGTGQDDRYPGTERLFNVAALPGYSQQPDFVRSDAGVAFDWRDNPLHPHAGGRYGVQFADYRDQDFNAFDFHRVSVDLQQFVPIPDRYRTIALHAAAVFTDPRRGQDVPFYFQPTLGGAQALRGFRENRFRDRDSVLLSAEYRWEAWWALDGALFVDAGQVAARRQEFAIRDFDVAYGVGLRIHSNRAFIARLDLGFSREGFIPFLRFEHAF